MLAVVAMLPAFSPVTQTQSFPDPLLIVLDLGSLLLLTSAMIKLGGKMKRICAHAEEWVQVRACCNVYSELWIDMKQY